MNENNDATLILSETLVQHDLKDNLFRSKTLLGILKEFDFNLGLSLLDMPLFLKEFSIDSFEQEEV